jgi:TRAP-type transport system periplasmic protein
MKKSRMLLSVIGLVALCCFFVVPSYGQEKAVTLKYSTPMPPMHKDGVLSADWAKEIEKRTNGRVKIQIFFGGTLTPGDKAYDGVVNGLSDLALAAPGYSFGRFPLTEILDYPIGYTSCLEASRLAMDYFDKFKPKEFDDVKVLYFTVSTMGGIHSKKPVNKLEDLKGMKLAGTGTIAQLISALGAIPVTLTGPERYDALSKGVVTGQFALNEPLQGFKIAEVVKYATEGRSTNVGLTKVVVMNKQKWNSLAPDLQKSIEEVSREWVTRSGQAWDEMNKSSKEFATKAGVQFIQLSTEEDARWAKAMSPLHDKWAKDKKAKGLPADQVLKFIDDELKRHR